MCGNSPTPMPENPTAQGQSKQQLVWFVCLSCGRVGSCQFVTNLSSLEQVLHSV